MNFFRHAVFVAGLALIGSVVAVDAPKANLQLTMLTKVNPQALALWEITNGAMDANGDVDGSKLKAAQWAALQEIGKALEEGAKTLAASNGIVAAPPRAKLQDEGNPGASNAADVQRYLDAKPAVFRQQALELQKTGASIIEAARKHDSHRLSDLAGSLDGVCENCHMIFWYPQQKK